MTFPIFTHMTRREKATAGYLNEVSRTIPVARASELHYIYSQLKAPGYLWATADKAFEDRSLEKNRQILRLVAFFWAAGVRPAVDLTPWDPATYINKVAFLLTAHRGLLNQELPTGGDRLWLFSYRETAMRGYLEESYPELAAGSFYPEALQLLKNADSTIYCAREEANFGLTHRLAEYLDRFCLLPEDVGITGEQLAGWLHQRLVEQARSKFTLCRTHVFEGDTYDPSILNIYANVYGVLLALTQGVSLEEAGITEDELRTAKLRLEAWLPDAIIAPEVEGVSAEGVVTFSKKVMPMFDEVLPAGRGLRLVR